MSIGAQYREPLRLPRPLRSLGFRVAGWCLLGQMLLLGVTVLGRSTEGLEALVYYLPPFAGLLNLLMWLGLFAAFFYNWIRGRNEAQDQQLLMAQLCDALAMGIPLPEALEALARHQATTWRSRWSNACRAVHALASECRRGDGLGRAMQRMDYFPAHWGALLEVAEARGALLEVLETLQLEKSGRAWFTTWFWVRLFSLWLLALPMAFFLCTYILPTFVALFEGMNLRLPMATQSLIQTVQWLRSPLGSAIRAVVTLGLLGAFILSHFNARIARMVRDSLSYLPPFRFVLPLQDQASIAAVLAASLRLGFDQEQALELAALSAATPAFRRALKPGAGSIPKALEAHPRLFGAPLRWLARQGDRHGNLEQALASAADYLAERADETKLRCSIWLDWAITVLFGMVVTSLVLGLYLPILQVTMNLLETTVMP
ncbi:hypothetical protein ABS71_09510 [bacterium SCN 62-11]|nr:type II secretion system F family protein [Candidatus Eremiobacteraeota bacterium]ODT68694.1 MAG: hypothetical protein ABS71_09510 [bacterium SCN 62-11]